MRGSGRKFGSRILRAVLLSHTTVIFPDFISYIEHISWIIRMIAYSPATSHRWESPSFIGPGTLLTPFNLPRPSLSSITKADVPNPTFKLPSLAAMADLFRRAVAIRSPLSCVWRCCIAHFALSGSCFTFPWRDVARILGSLTCAVPRQRMVTHSDRKGFSIDALRTLVGTSDASIGVGEENFSRRYRLGHLIHFFHCPSPVRSYTYGLLGLFHHFHVAEFDSFHGPRGLRSRRCVSLSVRNVSRSACLHITHASDDGR